MTSLDQKIVHELRLKLNDISLDGVKIGELSFGVLRNYLCENQNVKKVTKQKYFESLKNKLFVNYYFKKEFVKKADIKKADYNHDENLPLFIISSSHRRFDSQIIPLLKEMDILKNKYVTLFPNNDEERFPYKIQNKIIFIDFYELKTLLFYNSLFSNNLNKIFKCLKSFVYVNNIEQSIIREILRLIYRQVYFLSVSKKLVESINPKFIFCLADKPPIESAISLFAKTKKIKSFKSVQGIPAITSKWTHPVTDYLFVWSISQKNLYESFLYNHNKLIVSGAPQFTKEKKNNSLVYSDLIIKENKKFILFIINFQEPKDFLEIMDWVGDLYFCPKIEEEFSIIVRKHPIQKKNEFEVYQKKYKNIFFDINDEIPFENIFFDTDLTVVLDSTMAIDSLVNEVPVVVINPEYYQQCPGFTGLIQKPTPLPNFNDKKFFSEYILSLSNNEKFSLLKLHCNKKLKDFLFLNGDVAAKFQINKMKELSEN